MRSAQLVGLTPDGTSLLVVTDTGEELAIAADDRLRAALRGDRPRLGQLEIEMESALTPREIQTRIRAGENVDDVAHAAGIGLERVERFAAPVLAERDHVARQAMSSSVRRRGETTASRNLRQVVNDRLQGRGVDVSTVDWDSYRRSDGRWVVTATYTSGETERQAQFSYDPLGRFSVAGNDEAHWMLGDSSQSSVPQPGRRRPSPGESDSEPTLDLSDELALVRIVQDARDDEGEPAEQQSRGGAADSVPVPPLRVLEGGWEPPIVVNYPVEPGPPEDASDEPTRTDAPTDIEDRWEERDEEQHELRAREPDPEPMSEPDPAVEPDEDPVLDTVPDKEPDAVPATVPEPAAEGLKPPRRKRASVPSWDEIMFGGKKP